MAATLAHTATGAFDLARMANFITADRTSADVVGAGAFTTSPTGTATSVTILLGTNRTGSHTTARTKDVLASRTLFDTLITDDMIIAV
jgi:hypothetical protein